VASNGSETPTPGKTPIIGLTTYVEPAKHGVWDEVSALLPMTYVSAVIRSGGLPILLPPSTTDPAEAILPLDGLIVTGGPDVDPSTYGAEPHDETDTPRTERDEWEMSLCRAALDEDLPLLAICRGLQVLNVTLGGSLHQHLPEVVGNVDHRPVRGEMASNMVTLESGSAVASILGTEAEALCHHHQAIDRLGHRMDAVGFAADGTIEAVEVAGQEFALGVQWHPEDNAEDDRLFKALVEAATVYRRERNERQEAGR
jgi:putative glutamine amidotransferase